MSSLQPVVPAVELRRLDWAKELTDETLAAFVGVAELVTYEAGDVVVDVEAEQTHAYFIVSGRLTAELFDLLGKRIQQSTFTRGTALGLFGIALVDRSHMKTVAAEPTVAYRLTLATLLQLSAGHADFQRAVWQLAARLVKQVVTVDRSLRPAQVVGIVHQTPASRPLAAKLIRRLHGLDEQLCVLGDDETHRPDGDVPFRLLVRDGRYLDDAEREALSKEWAHRGRFLIDVGIDHDLERFVQLLHIAEVVLWCLRPEDAGAAEELLSRLSVAAPWMREKLHFVWLLDAGAEAAPYVPGLIKLAKRDFKLTLEAPVLPRGPLTANGFERLVHFLRGVQIGLALGGGAARGMAHLGVMKALEEHGIYVDRLAGTSAGAMTGTIYAAGNDADHATHCFKTDLQPSWFFRKLPGGGYWYLLWKYRRRLFEAMLRKYLRDYRLEQLPIPMTSIAVDLVEGKTLVRETGDATVAILESINLPPLALPIFSAEQALVDGGLLNNVPADVLVSQGCNFVIASTVTAKLEQDFLGIRKQGKPKLSRFFSTLQVMMRQSMILNHSMNAVGVQPADFVIAPDVTKFDISEFTRADEMSVIGKETTRATIDELKKLLGRLDPKLFPPASR